MRYRAGSFLLHCVLFSLFSLLTTSVAADATLYGLEPAFEGQFLTEAFQQTSIGVGSDGVITVVDPSATDAIIAHGTYAVTLLESSNGLVFHASGPLYSEYMSCAIDTRASVASCVLTESISTSTIVATFTPSSLPVVAVIPTSSSTSSTIALQTSPSTPSPSSGGAAGGSSSGDGLSSGALAGIIVAIIVVVLILIAALISLLVIRRRRLQKEREAMDIEKFPIGPPVPDPSSPTDPGSEGAFRSMSIPPSSQSYYEGNSSSPVTEKQRMFFTANANAEPPRSPPASSDATSMALSRDGSDRTEGADTRQILQEMRRMREEVAHLRTEANVVPPEYSET